MNLDQEITAIQERNRKVEQDKAWERSKLRLVVIAGMTYLFAGITLQLVGATKPWSTAFVPMIGWVLSTLSLPPLKRWWVKKQK